MSTQRVAIVTGAARGIGAATAERLGRDGFAVGVLDLDEAACEVVAARIRDAGGRAVGVGVDVTDAGQVEAGVARVAGELGPPVVLVNNAGIIRDNLIFKMTEGDWDAVMNVHLKGAFLMTKACQAHMTAEKHGRIVNLSSSSAQGNRGQANYSAAKAGLQGFTKTLAHTAQQIPVARVGQPDDIAATIAFLVSEEAGFVSGQVIYVAGGPLD
jgi:3-oxoacyl-[acyl-carrier protein] reductase